MTSAPGRETPGLEPLLLSGANEMINWGKDNV